MEIIQFKNDILMYITLIPISHFRVIFNRKKRIHKINIPNIVDNFNTKGIGFDDGLEC